MNKERRLGLSLIAAIGANLLAWPITTTVLLTASYGRSPDLNPSGFLISGIAGSVFSLPLGLLIGLPIQALMQRMGKTDLLSHIFVALAVGWPVGIAWCVVAFADVPIQSLSLKDIEAQFSYYFRKVGPEHLMIPLFLILASCIFWFIRRPDRDVAKALP